MNATLLYNDRAVKFCDCDPDDWIEGALLKGEWRELYNLEFIRALNVSGNYLDVGAYVGTHAIFFSLFCPASLVYAVEPQRDIFEKLCANITANQCQDCIPLQLVAWNERCHGHIASSKTNRGGGMFRPQGDVIAMPLDNLILPNIQLMKIDVENAEIEVVEGAIQTLTTVQHLFIESWTEEACERYKIPYKGERLRTLLTERGFTFAQQLEEDMQYYRRA